MKKNNRFKKISCIILTCDSHIHKSFCVLHCLCSLFNQDYPNVEIILIENSFNKDGTYLKTIKEYIKKLNDKRNSQYAFTLINNEISLDMGSARNIGARAAKGEVLVFVDDDTIITNKNALSVIAKQSDKYECGYGAKRYWTVDKIFDKNSKKTLDDLENGNTKYLEKNSHFPSPMLREGNQSKLILSNTFITNFGFCLRTKFFRVGPFPSYEGYGFHDDYLMYKLFEARSKLILLKNLKVIHVNHEIYPHPNKNIVNYFDDLVRDGYYWFNSEKMFMNKKIPRSEILQKIGTLHYDPILDESYEVYKKSCPLDLKENSRGISTWRADNQLNREEFARQIMCLKESSSLDDYVKNSEADFDNLAPIIRLAIDFKFISVDRNGAIYNLNRPNLSLSSHKDKKNKSYAIKAKSSLNQFPCDKTSVRKRIQFLRSRYPFAEYLKIAFIGDDDLLSIEAAKELWMRPIVIEKDSSILKRIKSIPNRSEFVESDIRNLIDDKNFLKNNKIHTFIADPPYTLNGTLLFLLLGLKMLYISEDGNEFYLIMNKTMMGRNLNRLLKIFNENGIYLVSVINNFSNYELPPHFSERKRANNFLKSISVAPYSLKYSSSSNIFVFRTDKPNIQNLQKILNPKLIYEHYQEQESK